MKKALVKTLHEYLIRKGRTLQKSTDKEKVTKLIQSLFPYRTQFDLIRMGPNGDGGYLVPDNLEGIEACFSPGVNNISGFELDCIKYGMKVFMADKSVDRPNLDIAEDKYEFIKKFIGCTNDEHFITMDNWVNSSGVSDSSDLLLQMDIEGSEYFSFINMSDSLLRRFRIMVMEFHGLHHIWNTHFFHLAQTVFDKILKTHICVHHHPNNSDGIHTLFGVDIPVTSEFTFIRKDAAEIIGHASTFPHKLDYDNTKKESISLPKNWYKSI